MSQTETAESFERKGESVSESEIKFEIDEHDFAAAHGRYPNGRDEFDEFVAEVRKGMDAQLDFDMIFNCIKEAD